MSVRFHLGKHCPLRNSRCTRRIQLNRRQIKHLCGWGRQMIQKAGFLPSEKPLHPRTGRISCSSFHPLDTDERLCLTVHLFIASTYSLISSFNLKPKNMDNIRKHGDGHVLPGAGGEGGLWALKELLPSSTPVKPLDLMYWKPNS